MEGDSELSEHREQEDEYLEVMNNIDSMAKVILKMVHSHDPHLTSDVSKFVQ